MRLKYKKYTWEEYQRLYPEKAKETLEKYPFPPLAVCVPVFLCPECKHMLSMDSYCLNCTDEECLFEPRE